ncbi:MAG TPA: MBL fold metallo-hydrolase [Chitinophagaceae bacterium]|nr:MBL fold metallo-hydrolase [Chitinophagaceae bacterium]
MRLHTINAGYLKMDGGAMFGVVPKVLWSRVKEADERNYCTWMMRSLLIEQGDRLILVDTGMGDKQSEKFFSHYEPHGPSITASLAEKGFSRDDITDVFLTHLHFDHCGGCINKEDDKLVLAFRNATYWCNKEHWQWAVEPNARESASFLKENILPIEESGQLKFVDVKEGIAFAKDIHLRFCSGHTRAMMLPQIKYKGETIVFMADLLPSTHHIPLPWIMSYDMFPMDSLKEKETFLKEALANDFVLYFEHDPDTECCRLKDTPKGIRAGDGFKISDL